MVLELGPVNIYRDEPAGTLDSSALLVYVTAFLAGVEPELISRLSVTRALLAVGASGFDSVPLPPLFDPTPDISSSIGYYDPPTEQLWSLSQEESRTNYFVANLAKDTLDRLERSLSVLRHSATPSLKVASLSVAAAQILTCLEDAYTATRTRATIRL
jgi:hypothetical protein